MNISNLLANGSKILKSNDIKTHVLDSELILSDILKLQKEKLIINSDHTVSEKVINNFNKLILRRTKKEPIAYILKNREFWSKDFFVNQNTLIPRPETELLCEQLIKIFKGKSINFLDIGTGTGCILLTILSEINEAKGIGLDISKKAIDVAKRNSKNLNLSSRAKFFIRSLEKIYGYKFDLVVSNPPYIKSIDLKNLQEDVRKFEPKIALDGVLKKLGLKENESIDHPWINKAMERAQQRVEGRNFDIRKTLIKFDDVMNDQRQVIFSQRLKILKSTDIADTLKSFFDEVINDLLKVKKIYQTTNDKNVFLSSIKNISGNVMSDDELINLASDDDNQFKEKIQNLFNSKHKERISLVGVNENNDIEKRIFLQIIDFSWRSHLQYLEQLRQVIGLRSYGQKDPLSEFKKEAFSLFEGLLEKIKVDVIKFMLNLNIIISQEKKVENKTQSKIPEQCLLKTMKGQKIQRNEKCEATGKKFKNCCGANL